MAWYEPGPAQRMFAPNRAAGDHVDWVWDLTQVIEPVFGSREDLSAWGEVV